MPLSSLSAIQTRIASIEARLATLQTGRPPMAALGNGALQASSNTSSKSLPSATLPKTATPVDVSQKTAFVAALQNALGDSQTSSAAAPLAPTLPVTQAMSPVTPTTSQTSQVASVSHPMPKVNKAVAAFRDDFVAAGTKHGVAPALLAAVAQTESAGNTKARSHVGALGLMQFMPATARSLNVDPLDPKSAIDGAARLLKSHMKTFGSTDLALAAYNAGPGNVRKYGGIPPFTETQNYVKKINSLMKGVNS